jgi:hypothetical protein
MRDSRDHLGYDRLKMSLVQNVQPNLYGVGASVITAATAAVAYATRVNPFWLFAAGGLLGLTGWL